MEGRITFEKLAEKGYKLHNSLRWDVAEYINGNGTVLTVYRNCDSVEDEDGNVLTLEEI